MKNENVVYWDRSAVEGVLDLNKQFFRVEKSVIDSLPFKFGARPVIENDPSKKQVIPYALFVRDGLVFAYKRNGSEKRLAQKYSVGVGGHVNDHDYLPGMSLLEVISRGLVREIKEEIGVSLECGNLDFIGMINEEESQVGLSHIGLVFVIRECAQDFKFDSEIQEPNWLRVADLDFENFELWSKLSLSLLRSV